MRRTGCKDHLRGRTAPEWGVIKITRGDKQNQKGSVETTLAETSGLAHVAEKTTMGSFPMKNAGSDEYTGV